jgi:2-dehydropantoate 2-reductase
MLILILGAGALGSLIGARLSQTTADVHLLTTDLKHIGSILDRGLLVEEMDGSVQRYIMPAYDDPRSIATKFDLIIVTVKTYDTVAAVNSIAHCCHSSTLFLTLQNGIGNWENISSLTGKESVLVGSTAQGATMIEPGMIRHGGNGQTSIGEFSGPPAGRVDSIVDLFCRARLDTRASTQMQKIIWEKLVVNIGINAITALTGTRNGRIAELQSARALSQNAVYEAVQIAQKKGFPISEEIFNRVMAVAAATANNRSSMGQDVDRKKRTEIDAINGAIVQFGKELQVATPVNQTLTQLIQTLQTSYLLNKGDQL